MRHKVAGWKLGRNTSHRRSLLRNLVTSLILEERIETTVPKAKAMRPQVEKMITLGKRGDLAARRRAAAYLMTSAAVDKLFDTISPRLAGRGTRQARRRNQEGHGRGRSPSQCRRWRDHRKRRRQRIGQRIERIGRFNLTSDQDSRARARLSCVWCLPDHLNSLRTCPPKSIRRNLAAPISLQGKLRHVWSFPVIKSALRSVRAR